MWRLLECVRIWGRPGFIHIGWDRRAQREIAPGNTVVFADGDVDQSPAERDFSDTTERLP